MYVLYSPLLWKAVRREKIPGPKNFPAQKFFLKKIPGAKEQRKQGISRRCVKPTSLAGFTERLNYREAATYAAASLYARLA
jgi:hypothetical protein